MKILHVCLGAFYIDGYAYQENILPQKHKEDGHDVFILASCETYINNKKLGYVKPSVYINEHGIQVTRIPYLRVIPLFIAKKLRFYEGVWEYLNRINPDVILSHDLCYCSVLEILRYKKDHPEVKLYADTHTARYNSGKNWLSLKVLHGIIYKYLINRSLPYLEKYLYIGESEKEFNQKVYGVPDSILELFPLGGLLPLENEYHYIRKKRRKELGVCLEDKLYVHSGKLEKLKRTKELLEAFSFVHDEKSKLVIIGSIPENQKQVLMPLIKADKRIIFLGWKTGDELREYLCACDIYCQPGTVSATLQNAICQYCAIISYPHLHYVKHLDFGNIFWVKSKEDMIECFERINNNPHIIEKMKSRSKKCAKELLDYKKLATRLYR